MDIVNNQMRAGKLWSQIEATFKQMDTAGTELECFQALQKQEQLAASHRINGLWEDVKKQKELERTLQKRYGDLIVEQERIESLMDAYRIQEEIAAKNRALELANAAANETVGPHSETSEPAVAADEHANSAPADQSQDEIMNQGMNVAEVEAHASPKNDMDVDAVVQNKTPGTDTNSSVIIMPPPPTEFTRPEDSSYEGSVSTDTTMHNSIVENHSSDIPVQNPPVKLDSDSVRTDGEDIKTSNDTVNGIAGENVVEEGIQDDVLTKPEDTLCETAKDGHVDDKECKVSSSEEDGVNPPDAQAVRNF